MLTGVLSKWTVVAGVVVTSLVTCTSEVQADHRRHVRYERAPVRVHHRDYAPRRVQYVSRPRVVSYSPVYYRPVEYRTVYVDSPVRYYDEVSYSVPSCSRVRYSRPYGFGASYISDRGRSYSIRFGH
ncbi:MAG: hypothetical protein AABZ47_12985 [Planctomycetota bacterium]